MPANLDEIAGYAGAGATLGSAIPGVGNVVGAGAGALYGIGKGWYDRHQNKKNRLRLEALNSKIALGRNEEIEKAILLQNESASSVINQQLDRSVKATDIAYAQSGAYRTGGRLKAENQMRSDATDAIIRTAGANALQGQALKQNALQMDRNYDLQMAQLEAAKQSGDTGAISSIAEQLVPALLSQIQGGGKGINPEDISSEGLGDYLSDTTPESNQPTPLHNLSTNILGVRPYQTPTNLSTQWKQGSDAIDFFYKGGL
jgi:hypothetical protein